MARAPRQLLVALAAQLLGADLRWRRHGCGLVLIKRRAGLAHDRRWRWWAAGIPGRRHEAASGGVGRRRRRVSRGRVDARARQELRAQRLHSIVVALIIIFFFLRSSFEATAPLALVRRAAVEARRPARRIQARHGLRGARPREVEQPLFINVKFQLHREELDQPLHVPFKIHGRVRVLRGDHLREVDERDRRRVLLDDEIELVQVAVDQTSRGQLSGDRHGRLEHLFRISQTPRSPELVQWQSFRQPHDDRVPVLVQRLGHFYGFILVQTTHEVPFSFSGEAAHVQPVACRLPTFQVVALVLDGLEGRLAQSVELDDHPPVVRRSTTFIDVALLAFADLSPYAIHRAARHESS